jgi:hypothetical protein
MAKRVLDCDLCSCANARRADDDIAEAKRSAAAQRAAQAEAERLAKERAEAEQAASRARQAEAEALAAAAEASAKSASERAAAAKAASAARLQALAANAAREASPASNAAKGRSSTLYHSALAAGCAAMNPVAAVSALAQTPPAEQGALLLSMSPFVASAALWKLDASSRERALASCAAAGAAASGGFSRQLSELREHLLAYLGGDLSLPWSAAGSKTAAPERAPAAPPRATADGQLLPAHFDNLLEEAVKAAEAAEACLQAASPPPGAPDALSPLVDAGCRLGAAARELRKAVSDAQASHSDWRRLRLLEQSFASPASPRAAVPQSDSLSPEQEEALTMRRARERILARSGPAAAAYFSPALPPSPGPGESPLRGARPGAAAAESPLFEWVRQGSQWVRQALPPVHLASKHPHLAAIARAQANRSFGHESLSPTGKAL